MKIFLLFYMCHFAMGLTHCYKTTVFFTFIKDVTVKQVALNVMDMDKINIASSKAVIRVSSFSMDTRSMSSSPRQKSTVQDCRHRQAAVSIHSHYEFVCGRHDAAWQLRSRNPQDRDLGCLETTAWTDTRKFGVCWRSSSTVARARRGVPVHYPVGTQSRYVVKQRRGSQ